MADAADIGNGSILRLNEFISASQAAGWRANNDLPVGGFAPGKEFLVVDARPSTYATFEDRRVLVADQAAQPAIHYAVPVDALRIFSIIG